MTNDRLSKNYIEKATRRLKLLPILIQDGGYSDVIRESQAIVELALKGLLRYIGVEPPRWHDVSSILIEHLDKLPLEIQQDIQKIRKISKRLRRERELAFYGDDNFIPDEEFDITDAEEAQNWAIYIVQLVKSHCVFK